MKYKKTGFIVLILTAYCGWALTRPLPVIKPTFYQIAPVAQPQKSKLKWPSYGGQAAGLTNYGVLATHGDQKPKPTASVAKVMVALAILNKKPLSLNKPGPLVPITKADVAIYKHGQVTFQSGVAVKAGEKITEYQALQALLIASANNLATTLTNWTFGSQKQYLSYANSYALTLGIKHTHFADASGLNSKTVSTPTDLILLGEAALGNPVIAQIVAQHSATLPVAGVIKNYNSLLTKDSHINGIKTGNTTEAGGVFLFSRDYGLKNKLIGVIMNAPTLQTALTDGVILSKSLSTNLTIDKIVSVGQKFAYYRLPWGGQTEAAADIDLSIIHLKGPLPEVRAKVNDLSTMTSNQQVGSVEFEFGGHSYKSDLSLPASVPKPSVVWRLLHP